MNTSCSLSAHGIAMRDELLLMNLVRAFQKAGKGERQWSWSSSNQCDVMFVTRDASLVGASDYPLRVALLPLGEIEVSSQLTLRMPIRPAAFAVLMERIQRTAKPECESAVQAISEATASNSTQKYTTGTFRAVADSFRAAIGVQTSVPVERTPDEAVSLVAPKASETLSSSTDLLIRKIRANAESVIEVRTASGEQVWIAPSKKLAWTKKTGEKFVLPESFDVLEADSAHSTPPAHAVHMDQFIWLAVSQQPNAIASRYWFTKSTLNLSRWPDLGRFKGNSLAVRLIALLVRGKSDIHSLYAAAEGDKVAVNGILNALAMLGFLKEVDPSVSEESAPGKTIGLIVTPQATPMPVAVSPAKAPRMGVFSRIRSALGLR